MSKRVKDGAAFREEVDLLLGEYVSEWKNKTVSREAAIFQALLMLGHVIDIASEARVASMLMGLEATNAAK